MKNGDKYKAGTKPTQTTCVRRPYIVLGFIQGCGHLLYFFGNNLPVLMGTSHILPSEAESVLFVREVTWGQLAVYVMNGLFTPSSTGS